MRQWGTEGQGTDLEEQVVTTLTLHSNRSGHFLSPRLVWSPHKKCKQKCFVLGGMLVPEGLLGHIIEKKSNEFGHSGPSESISMISDRPDFERFSDAVEPGSECHFSKCEPGFFTNRLALRTETWRFRTFQQISRNIIFG